MGKILRMSDALASQVAAGEVIERPASAVKELVENSLDAGARQISVEIRRGGSALIKVTDDGCGMSPEDAHMALERHATSKLRSATDLATVKTMGFRGEAVPSIASVGRFRLQTREAGEDIGLEITVEGGTTIDSREAGCAIGTTIEVKDLFFNIPARRKFLKAESTESAHVEHQVRLLAMTHPEVRFTLNKDGRQVFDLPSVSDQRMRLLALSRAQDQNSLISFQGTETNGLVLSGYLLGPEHARPGRRHQFFFLNNRPIEDAALSTALREGFGPVNGQALNPAAWVWIKIPSEEVDVNVHPAKREVRFQNIHFIREQLRTLVENTLRPKPKSESVTKPAEPPPPSARNAQPLAVRSVPSSASTAQTSSDHKRVAAVLAERRAAQHTPVQQELADAPVPPTPKGDGSVNKDKPEPQKPSPPRTSSHDFKLIGPVRERYFALEGKEGLVLLDPKAAEERVIYEQLLATISTGPVASQGLLVPIVLDLEPRDADVVLRHSQHFSDVGIDISDLGKGTLQVLTLPQFLSAGEPLPLLNAIIDSLVESGGVVRREVAFQAFASEVASVTARFSKFTSRQAEDLLTRLFECDLPFCAADGRPTLVQLSLQELDRRFGKR